MIENNLEKYERPSVLGSTLLLADPGENSRSSGALLPPPECLYESKYSDQELSFREVFANCERLSVLGATLPQPMEQTV